MPANKAELSAFLQQSFPQANCHIESVGNGQAIVSHPIGDDELRPGGTVSGPVMMKVADVALYVAILGEIGIVPLAVTTNLNVSFLRKPAAQANLIAKCQLIKVGRTLAVGDVLIYSEGDDRPVAHAVGTYALPADRD
ncbi:hotdog fold thioesterase [Moraxella osloensis]|uniref:Hotdog fold thioesterase n=1 Tax=Faucicola osloensis TaxID=34062 RepID=A0A6P1KAX3_FAUOS|nr:PaaI family thioesterase [Moraxella osloensis]QHG08998.1 hotdog fold thioesterase [Moraxella osloensis]